MHRVKWYTYDRNHVCNMASNCAGSKQLMYYLIIMRSLWFSVVEFFDSAVVSFLVVVSQCPLQKQDRTVCIKRTARAGQQEREADT